MGAKARENTVISLSGTAFGRFGRCFFRGLFGGAGGAIAGAFSAFG